MITSFAVKDRPKYEGFMMIIKQFAKLFVITVVLTVFFESVALSQHIDQQLFAEVGFSPEVFTICGLTSEDTSTALNDFSEASVAITQYYETRTSLQSTEETLMELVSQLADMNGEQAVLLAEECADKASQINLLKEDYRQRIVSLHIAAFASLSSSQKVLINRVLAEQRAMVPHKYKVLDWDKRQLQRLARALRLQAESPQSVTYRDLQLIESADSNFDVIQAEIWLQAHYSAVAQVFESLNQAP